MTQITSHTGALAGSARKVFLVYLLILALAGGFIVVRATSKQGPGVSTDAAMMMSAGENLLKGRGLVDFRGNGLAQYPPLEPLLLAFGSLLFHTDVFTVAWGLCILIFPLVIWFSGIYFYDVFREQPLLAYFSSFIVFSSTSLVEISSNVASDPLFLLIVVLFLMSMTAYLKTGSERYWAFGILLTILGTMERYASLSLVIVGVALTLYHHRDRLAQGILPTVIYAVLSAAPIFAWGFFHNVPLIGLPFGHHLAAVPLLNLLTGIQKVLHWFIPLPIVDRVGPELLLAILLFALLLILFLTRTTTALRKLLSLEAAPSLAFLPVYGGVLLFALSYTELKNVETDRVHIILLPALLIVLFTACSDLIAAIRSRLGVYPFYGVAIVLFLVWSIYPLAKTYKYVRESQVNGDVSAYNVMNFPDTRTSPLARYLLSMDLQHTRLYSNGSGKAWFILHRIVPAPPLTSNEDRLGYLQAHYAGWPGAGGQAYLIWFNKENYTPLLASPQELQTIADLQVVYSGQDGTVYQVTAR